MIEEPPLMNSGQERLAMSNDELQAFLHFLTESSVTPIKLNVTFNSLAIQNWETTYHSHLCA